MDVIDVPIQDRPDGTRHGHDEKQRSEGADKRPNLGIILDDPNTVPQIEGLHGPETETRCETSDVGTVCPQLGNVAAAAHRALFPADGRIHPLLCFEDIRGLGRGVRDAGARARTRTQISLVSTAASLSDELLTVSAPVAGIR